MSRSLLSAIGGATGILALTLLAAPAAAQESDQFRDWWVACGERRECAAYGFVPGGGFDGFVVVTRGAAPAAPVQVLLAVPAPEGKEPADTPLRLSVIDATAPRLPPLVASADEEDGRYLLARVGDPAAVRSLIAAFRQGRGLRLQLQGSPDAAEISLDGATAALRWMDDRQKRAGTVTALAATGRRPASSVPAPPPRRVVRAAAAVPQAGLPERFPAAMANLPALKACREEEADASRPTDLLAARLGGGRMLWGVGCGHGAYNMNYQLFLGDEAGRGLVPLPLRRPRGEMDPIGNAVVNPDFDGETMRLVSWAKGRGIGDCGVYEEWAWDGRAFQPVSEQVMGDCRGVPFDLWPELRDVDVRR